MRTVRIVPAALLLLAFLLAAGTSVSVASAAVRDDFDQVLRGVLAPSPPAQARLTAAEGMAWDAFGISLDIDGTTAILGADGSGEGRGAAYVFVRGAGGWTQQAKLTAGDGMPGDYFGRSVSLDGDMAVVGASGANAEQGAAYVFVRSGGSWTQQARLTAADGAPTDRFGERVAIDGDTALVGTRYPLPFMGETRCDPAYVFVRSGGIWTQQARLMASDQVVGDKFGSSLAIAGDTALLGASSDTVGSNAAQGSAYVFLRAGGAWSEQAHLIAADGAAVDRFGASVALDGDTALIGADGGGGYQLGSAYVFARSGTGWTQEAKMVSPEGQPQDFFGSCVAFDGGTAVIAATAGRKTSDWDYGAAYIFARAGGDWLFQREITTDLRNDGFAWCVALDGDTALVGAPFETVGAADNQGAAYVYDVGAPVTAAAVSPAPNAAGWNRTAVTLALSATDAYSGVAWTRYRLAGTSDWSSYTGPFQVSRPGASVYEVRSSDVVGNTEATRTATVRIDGTRPTTKALADVAVQRGKTATLRLRVADTISPQARVTVKIYKGAALKRTFTLGLRNTNANISYRYLCTLPRGNYTWKVFAADLAGNTQARTGQGGMVVR
jgi:hypothetical protein